MASQLTTPCSSLQQPLGTTQPRYLEQLENYLRKELLLLDLSTDSAQELRLQVRTTEPLRGGRGRAAKEPYSPGLGTSDFLQRPAFPSSFGFPIPGKRNRFYDKASEQAKRPGWNQNSPEAWAS